MNKLRVWARLMRLDKPIGIWLLLWPTLWALWVASRGAPKLKLMFIFVAGTVLMRSLGCVLNDIADRHFDSEVARTCRRPLAQKEISVRGAYLLSVVLLMMAVTLVIQLNHQVLIWATLALFLATSYPYTKRFLACPQAYLGITFGCSIPLAFAAVSQQVPAVAWLFWLANVCWAVAYDTVYAMQDRDDDRKLGIQSSALLFGNFAPETIALCNAVTLLLLVWAGLMLALNVTYYIGLALATVWGLRQHVLVKREAYAQAFAECHWLGFFVWLGLWGGFYDIKV